MRKIKNRKFSAELVRQIRFEYAKGMTQETLSLKHQCNQSTIFSLVNRFTYKWVR